jgi:hypothetical protein
MRITLRTARRATLGIVFAILGIVAAIGASAEPESLVEGGAPSGDETCEPDPIASTTDYLVGLACPPRDFVTALGYAPVLQHTATGWRYLKPASAGGACSGPLDDAGPFWDFADACRTHDYGYDLVRLGVAERPEADRLLFTDMMAACTGEAMPGRVGCRAMAQWARVTLDIGESLHMDPPPVARRAARGGHWTHHERQPFGSGIERILMLALVLVILSSQVVKVRPAPRRPGGVLRPVRG